MTISNAYVTGTNAWQSTSITCLSNSLRIYFSAVDPCLSNPCLNTGMCIGDADAQTYTCQCMPGFTGANCEDVVVPPTSELINIRLC